MRGEPDFERIDQDVTAIMSVFAAATCPQLILRYHSNNLIDAVLVMGVWEALDLSGRGTVRLSRQRCDWEF